MCTNVFSVRRKKTSVFCSTDNEATDISSWPNFFLYYHCANIYNKATTLKSEIFCGQVAFVQVTLGGNL